jgi:predicted dinucleotide-binding enzyme
MTKQVVAVLGGTGLQGGGVVDALMGAGRFAVRVASRNPASDAARALAQLQSRWSRPICSTQRFPFRARGGAWSLRRHQLLGSRADAA